MHTYYETIKLIADLALVQSPAQHLLNPQPSISAIIH